MSDVGIVSTQKKSMNDWEATDVAKKVSYDGITSLSLDAESLWDDQAVPSTEEEY